jgi:hypothetical protein
LVFSSERFSDGVDVAMKVGLYLGKKQEAWLEQFQRAARYRKDVESSEEEKKKKKEKRRTARSNGITLLQYLR